MMDAVNIGELSQEETFVEDFFKQARQETGATNEEEYRQLFVENHEVLEDALFLQAMELLQMETLTLREEDS